jgi:hypothetical protein
LGLIRRRGATAWAPVLMAAGCLVGLTGCGVGSFVTNQSVHVISPAPLTTVSAPFVVAWTVSGRTGPRFAVFVDQSPIAPGQSIDDLASQQCQRQPGCVNASYLAGLGVFLTASDQVTVPVLAPLGGAAGREAFPVHTVTVVLMDSQGRRVGDAAWRVEFRG